MSRSASIIIVTFNSAETIETCLRSVIGTLRPQDEVFIVDNNSSDNTLAVVRATIPAHESRVHLLPQPTNTGFSRGCNIGIEHSHGEYIILLNPDTEVFEDWIARLTHHFQEYDHTGAVGALTNSGMSNQNILRYFPDYYTYLQDVSGLLAALRQRFNRKSVPTRVLMGFCMALRREVLEEIGGLDEDIFLGDDDLELSWRLRINGFYLRVALDAFLNHESQVSFETLPKSQTTDLVQQGADVLYAKMQKYYAPARVPDPRLLFNIDWWRPSILKEKPYAEVFDSDILPYQEEDIIPAVKGFLKIGNFEKAAEVLQQALAILPNSYFLWYLAGSVYLLMRAPDKAEFALKNAWCVESDSTRARDKLLDLYKRQHRPDEANRLLGALPA